MKAPTITKPLADMTDSERYAYFKKTAPMEDLAFFLRTDDRMSDTLRARAKSLLDLAPAKIKAALPLLRAAWRTERNAMDRLHGIPAIGAPAWFEERTRLHAEAMRSYEQIRAESFVPKDEEIAS